MNGARTAMTDLACEQNPAATDDTDIPVLELAIPFQGFPQHRRFALIRLDEGGVMCALRSLDDPGLRFVVVPPEMFFEDYTPRVGDDVLTALEAGTAEELLTLVVITPGETPAAATANLMAPVLVNHRTRRAGQVVLEDSSLPLRAPLIPA